MSGCATCKQTLANKRSVYCSNKCQKTAEYTRYIEEWKIGLKTGTRGIATGNFSAHVIKYIYLKYKNKCALCKWAQINPATGKSPLEIDHIDGNPENNSGSNLILLCPNCHSLTPTYKNLNYGNGRRWRKQKYMLQ